MTDLIILLPRSMPKLMPSWYKENAYIYIGILILIQKNTHAAVYFHRDWLKPMGLHKVAQGLFYTHSSTILILISHGTISSTIQTVIVTNSTHLCLFSYTYFLTLSYTLTTKQFLYSLNI